MNKKSSSIDKVLDVLFLFANQSELTAQDISSTLNIPLSSTYKYLDILIKRELLKKSIGGNSYCLGLMAYKLGSRFIEGKTFLNIALPHMKSLSIKTKESVFLSVIDGWEGLIIEKVEPNKPFKLSVELTTRVPLHVGAFPKVLLAHQKDSFIEEYLEKIELKGLMSDTQINPEILRDQLKTIRKRGYALANSEVQLGLKAIAAPVFDHEAKIIASLAIVSPRDFFNDKKLGELVAEIKKSALEISNDLGFHKSIEEFSTH